MTTQWQYQIRLTLADEFAAIARTDPESPAIRPLAEILSKHNTALKSQYDAFAGYVAEAEANGVEKYHLYKWTKATIENPAKQKKYQKSFTLYVNGDEVYDKAAADALEADLQPLVGGELVVAMAKHDTNPANNPQTPAKYRK